MRRLLGGLRRPRCPLCFARVADLGQHYETAHSVMELRQWMETRR